MKHRIIQTVAASVLLLSYPLGGAAQESTESNENIEDTYIVGFYDSLDRELMEEVGGETKDVWESIEAAAVTMTEEEAALLSNHAEVEYVEVDEEIQVDAEEETELRNDGLDQVKATDAAEHNVTGEGVDVAVVDTGISTSHPSLDVEGGYSAVSYTDSYDDDNGHGSHTAGVIAANQPSEGLVGVAPDVDLYAVKVLDEAGSGTLSQMLNGMEWAVEQDVDVINMSFGMIQHSNAMESIVDEAYENDTIVVAASGNRGESSSSGNRVEYPARFDSVVAVGAVDENNERAYFSAAGDAVELAAPGVDIVSTYKGSSFGPLSGTSMASPFVVGGFALLKEAYPNADASTLREMLHDEALDLGEDGRDDKYGYGLLQIPDFSDVDIDKEKDTEEGEDEEQPVEEDIDENPISDNPIDVPEEDLETPSNVNTDVSYNQDGSANISISWDSVDEQISYSIFRDGELIDTVSDEASYTDENVSAGTYQYEVAAINENDEESDKSEAVEVTVETNDTADDENSFSWPDRVESTPAFDDVNADYWAAHSIEELSARGIIQGSDGEFRPSETVRRGQSLAMIGRLLEWDNTPADTNFSDVSESYFGSGFIEMATDKGYISGFSDGTFRPNDGITRGQMAAILGNVFHLQQDSTDTGFEDVDPDTTGAETIAYLAEHDIVNGYDDNTFRPNETLTRAQFASIFYELGSHLQE
ncbi:subtilisin [Salibacterium salarium]|uniref:S8 family serine peptidase n=1 Tax=Salibacterium salarium TaxID=284579 RepID=UPI00277EF0EE|nr:S8 family serine peptidase [Salibacterium salarium]MDQ0297871.1 subtilisin [Salibacterium salarium]